MSEPTKKNPQPGSKVQTVVQLDGGKYSGLEVSSVKNVGVFGAIVMILLGHDEHPQVPFLWGIIGTLFSVYLGAPELIMPLPVLCGTLLALQNKHRE